MTIKTKSRKTASKNSPSRPVANSASARKPAAKKAARTRPADVRKPQTALAIETPAIAATASLGRDSKQSRLIATCAPNRSHDRADDDPHRLAGPHRERPCLGVGRACHDRPDRPGAIEGEVLELLEVGRRGDRLATARAPQNP